MAAVAFLVVVLAITLVAIGIEKIRDRFPNLRRTRSAPLAPPRQKRAIEFVVVMSCVLFVVWMFGGGSAVQRMISLYALLGIAWALLYLQLVPQDQHLELKCSARTCPCAKGQQERDNHGYHRREAYPSPAATSTAATRTAFSVATALADQALDSIGRSAVQIVAKHVQAASASPATRVAWSSRASAKAGRCQM